LPAGEPAPPTPAAPPGRHAADLVALAGAGLGGPASGIGASLHVETFLTESVSVGASLSARLGTLGLLDSDELTTSLGVGAAWWPLPPTATRRLGLALRAQALLLYHAVSHDRPDGSNSWKGHALPGSDLTLLATWRITGAFELVVGAGAEVAFGTIDVTVTPAPQTGGSATIPSLRAVATGGLRVRF
jgi:hypothetical protein